MIPKFKKIPKSKIRESFNKKSYETINIGMNPYFVTK
jgi:hypothetical protein